MTGDEVLTINAGTSRLTIRTFAGGPLAALGHDLTFAVPIQQGSLRFDPENGTGALDVRIRAQAVTLEGGRNEKDRRDIERMLREKVLEVAQFPEIAYEAAEANVKQAGPAWEVEVAGWLTLHGVTRRFPLQAKVTAMGVLYRAFGEFTLRMSEFGIEQVTVAGGALKVKDEIKGAFDIVARP